MSTKVEKEIMMDEFIVNNDFIMASVDDDCAFEWEGKTSNTDEIITSLILEIKVLKDALNTLQK